MVGRRSTPGHHGRARSDAVAGDAVLRPLAQLSTALAWRCSVLRSPGAAMPGGGPQKWRRPAEGGEASRVREGCGCCPSIVALWLAGRRSAAAEQRSGDGSCDGDRQPESAAVGVVVGHGHASAPRCRTSTTDTCTRSSAA